MAIGTNRPASDAGFTLVELLAVVFITGLAASAVVMTLPRGADPVEAEARRLAAGLQAASEQALVAGAMHGLDINGRGYEIVRRGSGEWRPARGGARRLPSGVSIAILEQVFLDGAPPEWPEARFDTLGYATPTIYQVTREGGRRRAIVRLSPDGSVSVDVLDDV